MSSRLRWLATAAEEATSRAWLLAPPAAHCWRVAGGSRGLTGLHLGHPSHCIGDHSVSAGHVGARGSGTAETLYALLTLNMGVRWRTCGMSLLGESCEMLALLLRIPLLHTRQSRRLHMTHDPCVLRPARTRGVPVT
jgi:hypothetical protein